MNEHFDESVHRNEMKSTMSAFDDEINRCNEVPHVIKDKLFLRSVKAYIKRFFFTLNEGNQ